jgi:hypothetical protein
MHVMSTQRYRISPLPSYVYAWRFPLLHALQNSQSLKSSLKICYISSMSEAHRDPERGNTPGVFFLSLSHAFPKFTNVYKSKAIRRSQHRISHPGHRKWNPILVTALDPFSPYTPELQRKRTTRTLSAGKAMQMASSFL